MGKEKIEDIIILGYKSKHCPRASTFEIEVIMPDINVDFEFEKFDNELRLNFYPTSNSDNSSGYTIGLDENRQRAFQLCSVINKIRTDMQMRHTLIKDDCISKSDDIFMTALTDAADKVKNSSKERQGLIDRVSAMSLKINTLRKILNIKNGPISDYETLLTTILAFVDYYTNSNHPTNELSRLNVNDISYYRYLDNFECINRAIRDNCLVGQNTTLNNYLSARSTVEDKKANYLSGLYQGEFYRNSLYNTRSIDLSKANILDNNIQETEMEDD